MSVGVLGGCLALLTEIRNLLIWVEVRIKLDPSFFPNGAPICAPLGPFFSPPDFLPIAPCTVLLYGEAAWVRLLDVCCFRVRRLTLKDVRFPVPVNGSMTGAAERFPTVIAPRLP